MTEFVYEFARLLTLYRQAEQSAPELARAAVVWLSGQWAFLLLACVALLSLVLLLALRNGFRTPISQDAGTTGGTGRMERDTVDLFSLAKTADMRNHIDTLMEKLAKSNIGVDDQREIGSGLTLLLCACLSGQRKLVEYLLMKGADLCAVSSDGDTALILATYACCTVKGADPGLLDLLACRGVNVNTQNSNGDSPLSIAAQHGRTEILSVLLQYGADAHVANKVGCLPVDFAQCYGSQDSIEMLTKQMRL